MAAVAAVRIHKSIYYVKGDSDGQYKILPVHE